MRTAIHAGGVIDGTGADPVRPAWITIADGRIERVGSERPRDAEVIDASELTILPGLIDSHVHLGITTFNAQEKLLTPSSLVTAQALFNARATLEAGITTVRDGGGTPRGVRLAVDRGLFPGPRMRLSVGALSQTGGHGDQLMPMGVVMRLPVDAERPMAVVDGVDAVRRGTRELLRAGADQIKVLTSGGVMSPSDEPTATGFSPEEIAVVVYEAHAAGKTVMAHAHSAQGIKNAVLAGIESIEHGTFLDEEACLMMVERGTFLVPTLSALPWTRRRADADPAAMPSYVIKKADALIGRHREAFQLALRMGVRIAMGTDTGIGPHGANAEEISFMVEAGMTPLQAIMAATKTAAACLGLDTVGTLEPGKQADLIGVAGDPLSEPALFSDRGRVRFVMQSGVRIRSAAPLEERPRGGTSRVT